MATELFNDHGINSVEFMQPYRNYNEPPREFLRRLADGTILHDGDQVLGWSAGNLCVKERPRGEWMPDKQKSVEKIDPIVAVLMAFGRSIATEPGPRARGEVLTF